MVDHEHDVQEAFGLQAGGDIGGDGFESFLREDDAAGILRALRRTGRHPDDGGAEGVAEFPRDGIAHGVDDQVVLADRDIRAVVLHSSREHERSGLSGFERVAHFELRHVLDPHGVVHIDRPQEGRHVLALASAFGGCCAKAVIVNIAGREGLGHEYSSVIRTAISTASGRLRHEIDFLRRSIEEGPSGRIQVDGIQAPRAQ